MATDDKTGVAATDTANKTGDGDGTGAAGQKKEATVPLAALEAERKARQKLEKDLARLSGQVEGIKTSQPKSDDKPVVYTRTQLRAMVDNKQITQDQMDSVLEQQLEAKLRGEFEAKANRATATATADAAISAELQAYTERHPELLDTASDLRAKVQAEFDYLVRLGDDPKARATELKAVRMALGNLAPKGRRKAPETHQETNGSGEGDDGTPEPNDQFKGLPAHMKTHYEKMIRAGMYKGAAGEKALKAELDTARARQKMH